MRKVLFVCSGNTCRSPMAEGIFEKYLADRGIENVEISSAGTSAFSGDTVSVNSVIAAEKRGADISSHRARRINPEDILTSDLIVCMSGYNRDVLSGVCDKEKLISLEIPDPYMQSAEVYENCLCEIEKSFPSVLSKLSEIPVIRPMAQADIQCLCELEKECFSEPWSENSLREEIENPTARFFVIKTDSEILGYIGANNILDAVYITNIAVFSKHRGKGYGERLMRYLMTVSNFEYADFVTLEVRRSNEKAINLYEKCGFALEGERKNFYSNPREDALIYTVYFKKA